MTAKFDWYQTTVRAKDPQASGLVSVLLSAFPLSDYVPARGMNGYHFGAQIRRGTETLASLSWGGQPGINVLASSYHAIDLAAAIQQSGMPHTPTRIDSALDWVEEGLFDVLASRLIAFALDQDLALCKQGDWDRGFGRTLYVGSKHSPVRIRLYEKGHEQGLPKGHEKHHWVRFEATIRPKGKARDVISEWTAEDVFRSGWVPSALSAMGYFHQLKGQTISTVWRRSSEDRARSALMKQYAKVLERWADEAGGWHKLGIEIADGIEEMRREMAGQPVAEVA